MCARSSHTEGCVQQCNGNGVCADGVCKCDVPWFGPSCGVLQTRSATTKAVFGMDPNVSSWGGSILSDEQGEFHLFAAQMKIG